MASVNRALNCQGSIEATTVYGETVQGFTCTLGRLLHCSVPNPAPRLSPLRSSF